MSTREDPVGVFDSGVGGISTLGELTRILPRERFIYYGDTLHAPYGTKTTGEVLACVRGVTDQLLARGVKAIVIACNTATGAAAAPLRAELDIPVIGMEPALKPASLIRKDGSILVMATPLALKQEKFTRLMERFGEGAIPVPCEGLMELVEREDWRGAEAYLRALFAGFDTDGVDAVVLGCTHYVFLKDMIRSILPEHIAITDGNGGAARQLGRVMEAAGLNREAGEGSVAFLSSDGKAETLGIMERLYRRAGGVSGVV